MKEKSPAFQFYPKDFLTDGKVITMDSEMRGLYITLLCVDWLEDGFPEHQILKLAGFEWFDDKEYTLRGDSKEIEAALLECFIKHPTKPGRITNARLLKTRKLQEERHKNAVDSGSKGGKANQLKRLADVATLDNSYKNATSKTVAKSSSSSSTSSSSSKHKYGIYKNVLLTDEEHKKLKQKFANPDEVIKKLDEGIELKGYKYKSHYLAILKWEKNTQEALKKLNNIGVKYKNTSKEDKARLESWKNEPQISDEERKDLISKAMKK